MKRTLAFSLMAICLAASSAQAQPAGRGGQQPSTAREDALDPTPVNPAVDPNIDMFLNDWRNAKPRTEYGKLVFHDILTRLDSPDPVRPKKRGAVLTAITAVSYVTLAPGATVTWTQRRRANGRYSSPPAGRAS